MYIVESLFYHTLTAYISFWPINDCLKWFFRLLFPPLHFIPFGKFGPPYLGKATAAARVALPSPTSACWVFSWFRNPPHSDMDYRIFNVRTWSSVCMHKIHTGVGHTDESAQHFWLRKTLNIFSCALYGAGIWNSGLWISSPMLYQLSHPDTLHFQFQKPTLTKAVNMLSAPFPRPPKWLPGYQYHLTWRGHDFMFIPITVYWCYVQS